jgi:carbamoyl-phosphate synthase large subunit
MSDSKFNILITGAGAPGAAGIIHSLRQDASLKLIGADKNPNAYGRLLVDIFETIPGAEDNGFIDALISLCKKHQIKVLLPLVTKELLLFSKHIKAFEAIGTKVMVSDYENLSIANNKGKLYQFLKQNKMAVPDFEIVNNWDEMVAAFEKLGFPEKTVCIKPCESNGLRGFRILDNKIDALDLLLNHKPDSRYITFEALKEILDGREIPPYLVCEYLPGDEYTVDVLTMADNNYQIIPRLRMKTTAGISTEGMIEKNEAIIQYTQSIVSLLKLKWLNGVQVKQGKEGQYKILEINPRVQGTTVACTGAGVNMTLNAVHLALGKEVQVQEPVWGTKFTRHWKELYY